MVLPRDRFGPGMDLRKRHGRGFLWRQHLGRVMVGVVLISVAFSERDHCMELGSPSERRPSGRTLRGDSGGSNGGVPRQDCTAESPPESPPESSSVPEAPNRRLLRPLTFPVPSQGRRARDCGQKVSFNGQAWSRSDGIQAK